MKKYLIIFSIIALTGAVIAGILLSGGKQEKEVVKGTMIKAPTYLDVRTQQEWDEGHLNGAEHFDLARLQQGELPDLAKDTELAVYCRSGRRAGEAIEILRQNGFANARNAGGLESLQTQGFKVCAGTQASCN